MTQREQGNGLTRRGAMKHMTANTLGAVLAGSMAPTAMADANALVRPAQEKRDYMFFSKPFQGLSFDELGELAAKSGYTGIEFPVRPKGHIEPENVEEQLPKALETFRKHDIAIPLLTTGINEVSDEQSTERVLRTAAKLGIPYFRMAYYKYDLKKPIPDQLAKFGEKLDDLIALASKIGIKPIYQNHSGAGTLGAPIWDTYSLIKKHSPETVGLAYDIGHAMIESTKSWELQLSLVQDYIDVVYVKDPRWNEEKKKFAWAPLGQGIINDKFFQQLERMNFTGPVSLHVEYLDHKDPAQHDQFRQAFRDDLVALRKNLD